MLKYQSLGLEGETQRVRCMRGNVRLPGLQPHPSPSCTGELNSESLRCGTGFKGAPGVPLVSTTPGGHCVFWLSPRVTPTEGVEQSLLGVHNGVADGRRTGCLSLRGWMGRSRSRATAVRTPVLSPACPLGFWPRSLFPVCSSFTTLSACSPSPGFPLPGAQTQPWGKTVTGGGGRARGGRAASSRRGAL